MSSVPPANPPTATTPGTVPVTMPGLLGELVGGVRWQRLSTRERRSLDRAWQDACADGGDCGAGQGAPQQCAAIEVGHDCPPSQNGRSPAPIVLTNGLPPIHLQELNGAQVEAFLRASWSFAAESRVKPRRFRDGFPISRKPPVHASVNANVSTSARRKPAVPGATNTPNDGDDDANGADSDRANGHANDRASDRATHCGRIRLSHPTAEPFPPPAALPRPDPA